MLLLFTNVLQTFLLFNELLTADSFCLRVRPSTALAQSRPSNLQIGDLKLNQRMATRQMMDEHWGNCKR